MIDVKPVPKISYSYGRSGEKPELILEAEFYDLNSEQEYGIWHHKGENAIFIMNEGYYYVARYSDKMLSDVGANLDVKNLKIKAPYLIKNAIP